MTDVTSETAVLVRHAFYSHYGITRIAIDDNAVADLTGTDTTTVTPGEVTLREVTLLEAPGSPEWVTRMAHLRSTLAHSFENAQGELRDKINHLERLGEAILERANKRDWCEEYDTFAEEWDLPKRITEWEVTMTVRVTARNEDSAIEIVQDNVSIDRYTTEGIDNSPEFYASTV